MFSAFNPSKCTHTWSSGQPTLQRLGSSWGFGALLKGLTLVMDNYCRSRDSNPQPRVTSPPQQQKNWTLMHLKLNHIDVNIRDRCHFEQPPGMALILTEHRHLGQVRLCFAMTCPGLPAKSRRHQSSHKRKKNKRYVYSPFLKPTSKSWCQRIMGKREVQRKGNISKETIKAPNFFYYQHVLSDLTL